MNGNIFYYDNDVGGFQSGKIETQCYYKCSLFVHVIINKILFRR